MKRLLAVGAVVALGACTRTDSAKPIAAVALSAEGARHTMPRYSPDGSRVSYWALATDGPGYQLWVADAEFRTPVKLSVTSQVALAACWSRDGTRLAVASSDSGVADIVVVTLADGTVSRVTHAPGLEAPIGLHPDGDRVAYIQSIPGGITTSVVSLSTGTSTPLIPTEKRPVVGFWSPDGTKIIYNVNDGSSRTVWLADANGGNTKQLTSEGFEALGYTDMPGMMWSPDSKEVVYESRRTGTSDIWIVSVNDGKKRQLTRDLRNDYFPVFSPDGKWVAFISNRGQQTDAWMVPSAGGAEQRITDDLRAEATPVWRPDGKAIAFVASTSKGGVWSYSLADSSERRITPDSLHVSFFNLSPDGKQIDFVISHGGGVDDLAVANIDGTGRRTLLSGGGVVDGPYWSPDGSKIQFVSDRGGTADMWVIDAGGGAPRQLTNWPGYEGMGSWNYDGSAIYFFSDHEARIGDAWSVPVGGGAPLRVTNNGTVRGITVASGSKEVFVGVISPKDGLPVWARLRPGGALQTVWDETNARGLIHRANSDSVIVVAQDGSVLQSYMVSLNGGKGRKLLKPNEGPNAWSADGAFLLYVIPTGLTQDLGLLNVSTGETRRLTRTPDLESGSEFTPDGKTVLFRRMAYTERVFRADVSRLLTNR